MKPDALVIGGGAIGLSAALALGMRGLRVTVADRGQHGGMSSWAGAGILSPLPPWVYPDEVNQLALGGMAAWPEWAALLERQANTSPEYWVCGMEVRHEPDPENALAWCQAHHLPAGLRDDSIWLANVAQVRNPRLLAALKEAVVAQGGQVISDCVVNEVVTGHGHIQSVRSNKGDFSATQFVLATGAWSALPLGKLPSVPNVRPIRGQIVLYPPGSHSLDRIILQDGLYLVPRRDGHLLAGSTLEDVGFDARTLPQALESLKRFACELAPSLKHHEPVKSWAGLRPGSPDNLPLIDHHPDYANLWLTVGHYRYGVTMAPASATLLADLIEGRQPALDPSPYSWPAFSRRAWTAANRPNA